jgi:hypothetical protein
VSRQRVRPSTSGPGPIPHSEAFGMTAAFFAGSPSGLISARREITLIFIPTPVVGGSVMNWDEHAKNRNAVPMEALLPYENQHVAWSLDGTQILAGDADPLHLVARLKDAGYPSDGYVLSFVSFDTEW